MTDTSGPTEGNGLASSLIPGDWSFQEFSQLLPDAIIILDDSMQILFINSVAEVMFGCLSANVVGENLDIFLPDHFSVKHRELVDSFLLGQSGSCRMGDNRIVYGKHSSGRLFPLDITISKRKYRDQSLIICIPRDNQDQVSFEQALQESRQLYRGMIDSQHTLVVRVDREGRFVFVNQTYCQMFGKTEEELIGKSYTPLVHPDDLPATLEAMKDLQVPPYRIRVEQRAMTSQGWRWIAWEDSLIQDPSKDLYEIQAVGVDITEHKNVEDELSNKIALLSGLLNSIPDIVFFKDINGKYLGCNHQFANFIGKPIEDIVHKTDYDLFPREEADFFRENDMKMIEQGTKRNNEEWISYPDGTRVLLDTLKAPLCDSLGRTIGILGISRDITVRKRAEEIANIERNLAIILAQKSTLEEALPLCLDLALQVSGMDCGGIYLVDRQQEELVLKVHKGLSEDFVSRVSLFGKDTPNYQFVMRGDPLYQPYLRLPTNKPQAALQEGLRISSIIPVKFKDEVIACVNAASHSQDDMPEYNRVAIENLSFQLGNMIARLRVQQKLAESQEELQSMFDTLMDFVFVLDNHGGIIQVNRKVLDKLGYSMEELVGVSVLQVHPPEQREQAWKIVGDMLSGVLDSCPLDLLCRDGSRIPVETKVAHGRWGSKDVLIGVSRDITERKAAEATIRDRVKDIEGFFDVSLDLLCITDLTGHFLRLNKAWQDTLGFTIEELLQTNFMDLVHPDDLEATRSEVARLATGAQTKNFVNRYRCKDGSWRYIEWRSQMESARVYAAARDITERKAADDARLEQNRLLEYRQQFEETLTSISTRFINMPSTAVNLEITNVLRQIGEFEKVDRSYVFLLDTENGTMTNSHEWCAEGVTPEIDNLKDIPTSIFPWWMEKLSNLEDVHIPLVSDLPLEAQAEREILESQSIQSVLVVPLTSHNKLVGFVGFDSVRQSRYWYPDSILLIRMVSDILSNALMRIKMQSELRQSETRNTALLSAVPDLIFRIRRDGIFLDYKASSHDLLALPAEQIIGSSIKTFMPENVLTEAIKCIDQALQTREIQTMEYNLKVGDSSHTFEARFKDSGVDEVTAIVRDVSDRARLEQMKSDFINRATHELRTPIATMLLMVNLIDGGATPDEYKEYWDVLKSELGRERMLVEDLLSAGRLESNQAHMHFRFIEITDLVKATVHQAEIPAREKEIALVLHPINELDESAYVIQGDETALTQVFVNIIGNAIKFTRPGGTVDVTVHNDGNGVEVMVTDSGMGIPSEDIPLLFNRFFRGTNAIQEEVPGTGIGLFIVRSILEKHGGTIKVHSELGKGSSFRIWLPIHKEP